MKTNHQQFVLRAYSAKELAEIYQVCKKTFMRWLTPFKEIIGERQGRYYTINQVRIILEKIGTPEGFIDQAGNNSTPFS